MNDAQIKHMVSRFLAWKLPEHFSPDGGISFEKHYNQNTQYPAVHEPVGTNLFTATQATKMIEHMLEGMPEDDLVTPPAHGGLFGYPERIETMKSWRGRRLLACRAVDVLSEICDALGSEDGKNAPPDGGLPIVSEGVRLEVSNMAANLLRMILSLNDGHVSRSKLQRF